MTSALAQELEKKCKSSVEHLRKDLQKMRTGRASSGLLENINVDYYGSSTPLIQLGMISVPEPRLITVQVYDRGAVEAVEKAIMQADLGLNPARDGSLLRMAVPALTEERKKEIIKKLHRMAEEARVGVRGHRRECIDQLKSQEKSKTVSEDEVRRGQEEVQKIVDKCIGEIDLVLAAKEKEIMEV